MAVVSRTSHTASNREEAPAPKSNVIGNTTKIVKDTAQITQGLDKLQEARLKKSGLLTLQEEYTKGDGTTELINTFVRDPNYNQTDPLKVFGKEIPRPLKKYLKSVSADPYNRVKLNPKLYKDVPEEYRKDIYDDVVKNLSDEGFNDRQIERLTKDIDTSKFAKSFSKEGMGQELDFTTQLKGPYGDKASIYPEMNELTNLDYRNEIAGGIPIDRSTVGFDEKTLESIDKLQNQPIKQFEPYVDPMSPSSIKPVSVSSNTVPDPLETEWWQDPVFSMDESQMGPMTANLHGETYIDGVPSSSIDRISAEQTVGEDVGLLGGSIKKVSEQVALAQTQSALSAGGKNVADAVQTISKGKNLAQTAGQTMQIAGQIGGAYRAGKALEDGFQKEDIPEIAKGAVAMATPWLVAAGPAGWAVIGAAALHDLYELF